MLAVSLFTLGLVWAVAVGGAAILGLPELTGMPYCPMRTGSPAALFPALLSATAGSALPRGCFTVGSGCASGLSAAGWAFCRRLTSTWLTLNSVFSGASVD